MKPRTKLYLVLSLLVSTLLACSITSSTSTPTTAPTLTATVAPTFTPTSIPPLYQLVTLVSTPYTESGTGPNYTITAQIPSLQGSEDARVVRFNQEMAALVQAEITAFKQSLTDLPVVPIAMGSSFDLTFALLSPPGDLFSLKFDISEYIDGAAHPFGYSRTLTYSLASGADIQLAQLFIPGTDYLGEISNYCKADLATRDIAFDASVTGADPTLDNYRNWNITPQGLLITFDPYQVAAYAAGPQLVTIPYLQLQPIIDPNGPLADFLP